MSDSDETLDSSPKYEDLSVTHVTLRRDDEVWSEPPQGTKNHVAKFLLKHDPFKKWPWLVLGEGSDDAREQQIKRYTKAFLQQKGTNGYG